ncbi:MAG TPA: efflux transporter outer membrane subunit [Aliidongia sp.]|nr:efflux transporter outer membrane subunit [Aliidongia sp.]
MRRLALTLLAGTMLAGCSLIPDYDRPAAPVAEKFPEGPAYQAVSTTQTVTADMLGWHDFFGDPALQRLIGIALQNNRDLRVAALNIEAAQAQYRVQHSDLFPHIDVSGGGEFESIPAGSAFSLGSLGGGASSGSAPIPTGSKSAYFRFFNASVGFTNYELDLFGRIRSLSSQAFEQYLGEEETRRSAQISLIAEVAGAYFAVLADRELLHLTEETLKSETASYDLAKLQLNGGTATALSARQAETAVDTARTNLVQYTRQAAQDENALVLLLGQSMPADLPGGGGLDNQAMVADLPAGLPSDLLARRPDIAAAEHDLLAANANIGAARAAFFPSITLTASDGVASDRLSKLFTGGATTWSLAPNISLPIFTAGETQANLDLAKAQKKIQIAQYEKTIQTAFREVADALAARGTYGRQVQAQLDLVAATEDSLNLSQMRFKAGVDSYLPVLDAERSLYTAQQTLLGLKQAQLTQQATLYKALGGGWVENTGKQEASAKE